MNIRSLLHLDACIFRRKPVSDLVKEATGERALSKVLGPFELTFLGVGAIIGTGIFVITGIVAAKYAGPALVLSFIISGLVCVFAAFAYAEFASMVPVAGSAYTYSYASLGELWAWIIGWDLILEYAVSISAVAIGWSGYMVNLLGAMGIILPPSLTSPPGVSGGIVNLPAILITMAIAALLTVGVRESARINTVIVGVKILVISLFIYLGLFHINTTNWHPFLPFGWSGVITGAAIAFFAYIGFDAVSTAAEEVKNPQRNLPIGILGSLVICTVLYIAVAAVLTGIVPYSELGQTNAPVAFALTQIGVAWGSALVSVGAICGITSVLIVTMYGQTRIFFAMARDGLLPRFFSEVHPRLKTPVKITLLLGVVTALISSLFSLEEVTQLVNIGTLAAFTIVSVGVIVLRRVQPGLQRPFKCPFVPYIPILCIVSCGGLILALPTITHLRFVVWLAIGLVIYLAYGRFHCVLNE